MSKSIYEETFTHLDELVDVLAHIEGSFLYRHYLDNIRLKLKKAQKQEKLLELYKELSKLKDDVIHLVMFGKDYEHLRVKTVKIEQQIKELEK